VYRGIDRLETVAAERGVHMASLALAWALSHPLVAGAIVGPRRPSQLEIVDDALRLELGAGERDELARLFDS
jgi:aryl-alcohol dehydrogenase-like predicted oxidoreductase